MMIRREKVVRTEGVKTLDLDQEQDFRHKSLQELEQRLKKKQKESVEVVW